MIIEILKIAFYMLVLSAEALIVLMFILGFWHGFFYETGEEGSKYHVYFKLLPFKRFFKKKPNIDAETEKWVARAIVATFKGYTDWLKSDDCRTRYKDNLVDITDEVEIYGIEKNPSGMMKHIQKRLEESGITWKIGTWKEKE